MHPEYLDSSAAAKKNAVATVVGILKASKVNLARESSFISVLEPAMPAAIKALYKSGFHRTNGPIFFGDSLALRRLNILVEVQMPRVKYGANVLVERIRKKAELSLTPVSLSKAGVIARTKEDSLIDISYASILELYKETEKLNAWRNHMEFMLPDDCQIAAVIALLDACVWDRKSGSAVDYDKYDVRWGTSPASRSARLIYVPSRRLYELEVKIDAFSWSSAGTGFDYQKTAADLALNVECYLETHGDTSPYRSITEFRRQMLAHFSDMSSPQYEETKYLAQPSSTP